MNKYFSTNFFYITESSCLYFEKQDTNLKTFRIEDSGAFET